MKVESLRFEDLRVEASLARRNRPSKFLHLLEASIREVGLAEPLKVARIRAANYVIVDGILRHEAICRIRETDRGAFNRIPAVVYPYEQRFEIRYQTDIYQDLMPSQLAQLVEHLHAKEGVSKQEMAASLGIARPTLRNYTGLFRLASRGGISRSVVALMDVQVMPSSNPYAWLRLTTDGLRKVIEDHFSEGHRAESWFEEVLSLPAENRPTYSATFVEKVTSSLEERYYRQGSEIRGRKKALGRRRTSNVTQLALDELDGDGLRRLEQVAEHTDSPVLRVAALNLRRWIAQESDEDARLGR
jgi:hypothetical protein